MKLALGTIFVTSAALVALAGAAAEKADEKKPAAATAWDESKTELCSVWTSPRRRST